MDVIRHNAAAWDSEVAKNTNKWTLPVSHEEILEARKGSVRLLLTPTIPVPEAWFKPVAGKRVLCLASGGGQQTPLLAAMGAEVTVFDNSPQMLAQDRMVAEREGLRITAVQGDMKDLSCFPDASFDLVFHPVSNCFVDRVEPVWRECYRVLRPGGALLAGFANPVLYLFDLQEWEQNQQLVVRHSIPYSDTEQLPREQLEERIREKQTLEFGHTLDAQIGGQLKAGFQLTGFYEDIAEDELIDRHLPVFIATRAVKP